jgi:hypothetical protein
MAPRRTSKPQTIGEAATKYRATSGEAARQAAVARAGERSAKARRRALELATDLVVEIYGPALRELEKH